MYNRQNVPIRRSLDWNSILELESHSHSDPEEEGIGRPFVRLQSIDSFVSRCKP